MRHEGPGKGPLGSRQATLRGRIGQSGNCTSQKDGEILELGYLKCIDTCCYGEGWLTALEVETDETWQADKEGEMRDLG